MLTVLYSQDPCDQFTDTACQSEDQNQKIVKRERRAYTNSGCHYTNSGDKNTGNDRQVQLR